MYCTRCGKEIRSDQKFCGNCGAKNVNYQEKNDLKEMIEKAVAGEENALEKIYNLTYVQGFAIALQMVKNEQDAMDIMQDAYISAFRNLKQIEDPKRLKSWFNCIVANKCKDWLKKKKPQLFSDIPTGDDDREFEDTIADENLTFSPEGSVDYAETKRLMKEILDGLPEDQKLCVLMYYYEELSVADIADALGCSTGTVKSRLNYARKKIRNDVEELERKGTKLYSVAPLPFILWMLREGEQTISVPGSFGKELVRQGAGIVKSGSAPTSGNTGSGKSGIRKTDPVKNGQAAGRKIVKVRQGAGIVKSGSAPTSGNTGSGKSGIRKTDPVKNGQAAGRKIVKSAAGKAAGKIIGTKAVAGVVGAAVIGGGVVAGYHIHQAKEQKVTKEEWQAAYKDWVGKWSDDTRFELFDMNGDDVPEIVRVGSCMADGATVATCTPDGIREEEIYRIGMWYIPGGNVLDNNDGNMGVFYDRVFEIKDGEWLQIGDGECRMEDNTNPEYDENGDYVFRYKWDGKEVTNKKYEKKLKKLFGNRKPEALGNEAVSYHEIINQISHY